MGLYSLGARRVMLCCDMQDKMLVLGSYFGREPELEIFKPQDRCSHTSDPPRTRPHVRPRTCVFLYKFTVTRVYLGLTMKSTTELYSSTVNWSNMD